MNPQRNLNDSDIENAGHPGYVSPSANAAPKPLSDGKYAQPVPHQKGVRSFHVLKVILISGLLLAAAIGVIAVILLFAQSSTKRTTNEQKKAGETKLDPLTAQQTIERTAVYFKGQEKAKTPLTIPIKVKGKNFYTVIPDVDILQSLAGYVPKEMSKQQRESIEKSLDYDKFVKKIMILSPVVIPHSSVSAPWVSLVYINESLYANPLPSILSTPVLVPSAR